jgi:flagellar basal body-associated protein FliL
MNQKTGICIFIVILLALLVLAWVCRGKFANTNEPATETETTGDETQEETTVAASTDEAPVYAYLIREQDDVLVVYMGDGETVYMETGIRASRLSDDLHRQLEDGIGFSDEESLFSFLENYAS